MLLSELWISRLDIPSLTLSTRVYICAISRCGPLHLVSHRCLFLCPPGHPVPTKTAFPAAVPSVLPMLIHMGKPICRGGFYRKPQPLVVDWRSSRSYPLIPKPYYYYDYYSIISKRMNKPTFHHAQESRGHFRCHHRSCMALSYGARRGLRAAGVFFGDTAARFAAALPCAGSFHRFAFRLMSFTTPHPTSAPHPQSAPGPRRRSRHRSGHRESP